MVKNKKENKRIFYDVFSMRLSRGMIKHLKKQQKKSGLSWNRYMEILSGFKKNKDENTN